MEALEQAPRTQYFSGFYFQRLERLQCRADQTFHIYSRPDVLRTALEMTDHLPAAWEYNWGITFGLIARHLTVKGQLKVVDDNVRVDSQQRTYSVVRDNVQPTQHIPEDYCKRHFAMHLFPSHFHINASAKMFEFVNDPKKQYTEPSLAAPKCYGNIPQSCASDWLSC